MKSLIIFIATYCLFLTPVFAEVTEYDIELIIFEDISGRYANSEQWRHEPVQPASESTSPDTASKNKRKSYSDSGATINISQIKGIGLNKYARKLKSSKRYHVLVHKAWRQTGLSDEAAIDIPVDSRLTDKGYPNNINGSIRIVLGRYLHIYTDMIYQQSSKDTTPDLYGQFSQRNKEYPIKFHRRMRSKELHYLDHPIVGIIVMAKPVKKPKAPKQDT